jgi:hypothetical protein
MADGLWFRWEGVGCKVWGVKYLVSVVECMVWGLWFRRKVSGVRSKVAE